jgi:TolA-binding protein
MRAVRGGGEPEECRGDLIARERRGELSGNECLALRAHVAECGSCRMARQVFVDLDDVSGVDLRDGLRIEKMTLAARRWGQQASRPRVRSWARPWAGRRPLRTLAFAAVVLLIGGTASATMWWFRHPQPSAPLIEKLDSIQSIESGQRAGKRQRRKGEGTPAQPQTAGNIPASEPAGIAVEAPAPIVPVPVESPSPVAAPPVAGPAPIVSRARHRGERRLASRAAARGTDDGDVASSAATLLRQASGARRAGDAERAITLYRKLQQDFPRSAEATLSSVSLGGLLLDRRLPRAALSQFDGYLVASRGGVLIPEALYGRGRALAALGDRQEERHTWDRLLTDFPESTYAPFAKRRSQELK